MTQDNIITTIKKDSLVERIVYSMLPSSRNPFDFPDDLIQDLYLYLLQKDQCFIERLYLSGELPFYILRMTRNQLLSKNSPYYYRYIKFRFSSEQIEGQEDKFISD